MCDVNDNLSYKINPRNMKDRIRQRGGKSNELSVESRNEPLTANEMAERAWQKTDGTMLL